MQSSNTIKAEETLQQEGVSVSTLDVPLAEPVLKKQDTLQLDEKPNESPLPLSTQNIQSDINQTTEEELDELMKDIKHESSPVKVLDNTSAGESVQESVPEVLESKIAPAAEKSSPVVAEISSVDIVKPAPVLPEVEKPVPVVPEVAEIAPVEVEKPAPVVPEVAEIAPVEVEKPAPVVEVAPVVAEVAEIAPVEVEKPAPVVEVAPVVAEIAPVEVEKPAPVVEVAPVVAEVAEIAPVEVEKPAPVVEVAPVEVEKPAPVVEVAPVVPAVAEIAPVEVEKPAPVVPEVIEVPVVPEVIEVPVVPEVVEVAPVEVEKPAPAVLEEVTEVAAAIERSIPTEPEVVAVTAPVEINTPTPVTAELLTNSSPEASNSPMAVENEQVKLPKIPVSVVDSANVIDTNVPAPITILDPIESSVVIDNPQELHDAISSIIEPDNHITKVTPLNPAKVTDAHQHDEVKRFETTVDLAFDLEKNIPMEKSTADTIATRDIENPVPVENVKVESTGKIAQLKSFISYLTSPIWKLLGYK